MGKPHKSRRFILLLKRISLCILSLFLTLATLEAIFRLAGIQGHYPAPRIDTVYPGVAGITDRVPYGFVPGSTIVSIYDSDPRGYFGPFHEIEHRFNSVGWRDDEHTIQKPKGWYRILGLGDSYLFGQGVRQQDICLNKLKVALTNAFPDRKFECINAGISAYNTANQRDLLRHCGRNYDPDLVIVHFVLNDVEPNVCNADTKIEFFTNYLTIYQSPDALSNYSHLWSWARQRYLRNVVARAYLRSCVDSFAPDSFKWRQCREAIDEINILSGGRLLVVIFPFFVELNGDYPFQRIHDAVREHCTSSGIPVLDLRPSYVEFQGPDLWVHPTDQHPNEKAHAIAASAVAAFIGQRAKEFNLQ